MPVAIGPLGPLLAEPAQARSEASPSGRGKAFTEVLETEGRAGNHSSEEDGERRDGSAHASILSLSVHQHAGEEELTASEREGAPNENSEAPAEDKAPEVAAVTATTPAPALNEADLEAVGDLADEPAKPDMLNADPERQLGQTSENIEVQAETRAQGVPTGEAPLEAIPAKAGTEATDIARPPVSKIDGGLAEEDTSTARIEGKTSEGVAADVDTVSRGAVEGTKASDIAVEDVAALKADKADRRDNVGATEAQIKGSEAPGRPDLVMASLNPSSQATNRNSGRLNGAPASDLPARPARDGEVAKEAPRVERADTRAATDIPQLAVDRKMENASFLSGGLEISAQSTSIGDSGQQAPTLSLAAAPAAAPIAAAAPVAGAPGFGAMMTPAQATIVAAPQEIVDIVSNKLAGGDKPERIMVQLDPPELGRVSIEFKFDAQGLQQVAVRADTPEAMKQLRLLHFDLVQSLEQHGLSARDMTFSEGSANGSQNQQASEFIDYTAVADIEAETIPAPALLQARRAPITIGASGLNIKL
ncbi:flagellar hook-length control protein FliK [Henriciella marina]|uniref:Flagellar hook-length control protein FliK n=1 Tax=Henriciella marina TaxID=453851 RepID=A0ABT4LSY6_9PROT|nr:flagellar hook-length control protein FliK [Henriciella marina]MCZ4297436.1 flagellar hook-length control protein FliK [Henriciella marina]